MLIAVRDLLRNFDVDVTRVSYGKSYSGRLKLLLREQQIDCVVDVGANVGQFAKSLRALGYKGSIISFEPAAESFRLLEYSARKEPLWHPYRLALGSEDKKEVLNVMEDNTLNSFYEPNAYGVELFSHEVVAHQETVSVRRLDSLFTTIPQLTTARNVFLKIDTQGHDREVFRGASGCLTKIALLQMELCVTSIYDGVPEWQAVAKEVQEAGFGVAGLFPINFGRGFEVIEFDGLFIGNRCRL